ncbi:MAG: hypothetical protein AB7E27_02210 [Candidatus Methanomethylophilaceae archaeon]
MELSLEVRLLAFAALAAAMVLAVYFELKVVDKRKESRLEARKARDELYNLVVTTEAIAESLCHQGLEVGEAETLSHRAHLAYDARDIVKARTLAMQARRLMVDARTPEKKAEEDEDLDIQLQDNPPPWAQNDLPDDNSLPSRFMIECARSELESWDVEEKGPVSKLLEQAESAALDGDYDKALSLAHRARCRMSTGPCEEDEEPPASSCPKCFNTIEPDDRFCACCGHPLSRLS